MNWVKYFYVYFTAFGKIRVTTGSEIRKDGSIIQSSKNRWYDMEWGEGLGFINNLLNAYSKYEGKCHCSPALEGFTIRFEGKK